MIFLAAEQSTCGNFYQKMILPVRIVDHLLSLIPRQKITCLFLIASTLCIHIAALSQENILRGGVDRVKQFGNLGRGSGGGTDSLKRRDRNEDSITVRFRYLDS